MKHDEKLFEEAKQNFIEVNNLFKNQKLKHTSSKYRFLAPAVKRQSEQYLYEAKTPKRKYWKFNRGALVFVEFGVNIGGELSNNHWAIVLDKNDSPYKKTLTIIPVSSKESQNTVPIQELIGSQPMPYIGKKIEELRLLIEDDNSNAPKITEEIAYLREVIAYYGKYLKQSYAKCDSIQTISKDRILKKNPLDPVGKIKVSPTTLDLVNQKLSELYLNEIIDNKIKDC